MRIAEEEFKTELLRQAVDREKERLRQRKRFWVRLFPWRIRIERRDSPQLTVKERVDLHVRALQSLGVRVREDYGMYTVERTGGK